MPRPGFRERRFKGAIGSAPSERFDASGAGQNVGVIGFHGPPCLWRKGVRGDEMKVSARMARTLQQSDGQESGGSQGGKTAGNETTNEHGNMPLPARCW